MSLLASTALLLQGFETGVFSTQLVTRWWSRQRDERTLLGETPVIALPVVDEQLRKHAGQPTRTQERIAQGLIKTARTLVRTKAFEHLITRAVVTARAKDPTTDLEVKLWL